MTAPRLEVRIRHLVLDGVPAPSPEELCTAIEAELAALLGLATATERPGTGRKGRDRPGDGAVGPARGRDARLGRTIALAVHRALCRATSPGDTTEGR
ncbi:MULTISPECIES: hypothetical protein [unclassified Streptomyces]|uniref:hypothetical protein n=1 Tax=unclassified Streptomyces TaxID=2593676 RepID=UPI003D70C7E6